MHTRPTSNNWKYFAVTVSEKDLRSKRTKRKVWTCKRKTNGDGKDLWWIKSKIPEGNKKTHNNYKKKEINWTRQNKPQKNSSNHYKTWPQSE